MVGDGRLRREAPTPAALTARREEFHSQRRCRRILSPLIAIGIVLATRTAGIPAVTGSRRRNSFHHEPMRATGQGPPFPRASVGARRVAALVALVSVGTVSSTLALNPGPILGQERREAMGTGEHDVLEFERDINGKSGDPES